MFIIIKRAGIEMLCIAIIGSGSTRTISLRPINPNTFELEDPSSSPLIEDTSNDYISTDNSLAYYPNYNFVVGGSVNTAVVFVNLPAVIPCYDTYRLAPVCHLFSFGDHSYIQQGRPYVQFGDTGNHVTVFNGGDGSHIEIFGFGVSECSTFHSDCVSSTELNLVCVLPTQCYS